MKIRFHHLLVVPVLSSLPALNPLFSAVAQGSLTPPGAPTATMKSLDQLESRTPISALPFNITNAGSYYCLGDMSGVGGTNGITVAASDVSLDLRGFTLRGVAGASAGIMVVGNRTNLCIHSGIIRDWPTNGIQALTTAQDHFYDLQVFNNSGSGLITGGQSLVEKCQFVSNGKQGVTVGGNSQVQDCVANGNGSHGIQLNGNSTVLRCVANANDDGIHLNLDSLAKDCVATGNTNGIRTASRSSVIECDVSDNQADGIVIPDNGYSLLLNNTCARNLNGAGIHAGNSTVGTRIEGNNAVLNGIGIRIDGTGNLVIRNSARDNGTNYFIASGNSVGPTNTSATILTNNNPSANFSY